MTVVLEVLVLLLLVLLVGLAFVAGQEVRRRV